MPQKDLDKRREYQREYQKKWRKNNPERSKAILDKHEELHHDERLARRRELYAENIVENRIKAKAKRNPVYHAQYYQHNRDIILARMKEWREANPELHIARGKDWFDRNKERKHATDKIWRSQDIDLIGAQRRENTWALKLEVWSHYGMNCVCCGEERPEFLTIDHINGGGSKHRKEVKAAGYKDVYYWLMHNNYPDGFRVLCMNCNFAHGMYGYCPHVFEDEAKETLTVLKGEII